MLQPGVLLFSLFIAVTLIQLCYYGFFFRRLAVYRTPDRSLQQQPVSVIVCARDEDENLARHLPGLLVQDYPATHEVLVIDDNSLDDSKYILEELKRTFPHLQVIRLTQEAKLIQGKKYPLSIGIKEARHEVVLLTDADCVPATEHWLQKMQAAFTPGVELVLGYGAYYRRPGLLNKLIRWETAHTALQYLSYALAGQPYMGVGRNMAYTKDLFFRNKGFASINHIPSGDDDLFVNKAATAGNTAIVIDPEAFTLSRPKQTWKEWMRQKTRHYTTGKYYKTRHKFLLGLYTGSLVLFYPLFLGALLFFDWRWALIPLGLRLLVQALVLRPALKRLGEGDLFRWFPLFDLWMIPYYFLFAPTLWKKARKSWQ
ncbi:MAG TPA: glycosyltransferase [Chitinophagaceae bacterium]|jgi:cellulose synthase/poly-beta-1,6-N-acetylglucosamine synthase-like glycosyltransferase|nr:glycosyltransferase [Chitinophagaceae bacterium]